MGKPKVDMESLSKEERIKLAKVLKEQYNADGSNKEVSWMYQQKDVDSEAFLTGKKITDLQDVNLRDDYNRGTASAPLDVDSTLLERRGKMDLEAKLKEDPLELIKAKEIEQKRKLLENTAKLKKLEKVIKSNSTSDHQKSQKKRKKKKKHRRRSSSSSSSGDDLLNQFLAIVEKKNTKDETQNDAKKHSHSSDSDNERKRDNGRRKNRSISPQRRHTTQKYNEKNSQRRDRDRSRSPPNRRQYLNRPELPNKREYGSNRRRSRSPVDVHSRNTTYQKEGYSKQYKPSHLKSDEKPKKKMSVEEMARLREEMQKDAKSRDEERAHRVHSHRKEKELEEKELEKRSGKGAGFLRPMVMKHADTASVEENVRRRIHTNQRPDTDNNFVRK